MAKQTGPLKVTGKLHGVTYYKMEGKHYARSTSSLSGKRVKVDPAFAETMRYAGLLGMASKIASAVYKAIPKEKRKFEQFRRLIGQAMQLLKERMEPDAVQEQLVKKIYQ